MRLSIKNEKMLTNLTFRLKAFLRDKKVRLFFISVIILLILFTPSLYFYNKYQGTVKMLASLKNPSAESEVETLIKKVSNIIILPQGEVPTIATVTDKNKVNNQVFFSQSENGDRALIYTQAKKAFLYRPSANKIIEVMPISIESSTSAKTLLLPTSFPSSSPTSKPAPSETEKPNPKIAIYNGTKINGLAKTISEKINKANPEITDIITGNAVGDYKVTQIIDITGGNSALVNKLNSLLSGKTTTILPEGEKNNGADIVILLGEE